MMFSILVPTRNRLQYLKQTIETALRQDDPDWEMIVSDNDSAEDVEGHVRSVNDARVKYIRTQSFVPVTENWNLALNHSSGDYVIMLGDDDGLMPGALSALRTQIEAHSPAGIYTAAYLYAFPGVMPGAPQGYLHRRGCADFLNVDEPFFLEARQRRELVRQSMKFRLTFDYNMQFFVLSRTFIESLGSKGAFFQSSFPDYYAANVTFLAAPQLLVMPQEITITGISPKSYGFFLFNNIEMEGKKFLEGESSLKAEEAVKRRLRRVLLPGSNLNDGWLLAMEALRKNYGWRYGLKVSYRRYRLLQIFETHRKILSLTDADRLQLRAVRQRMSVWEHLGIGVALMISFLVRLLPGNLRHRVLGRISRYVNQSPTPEVKFEPGEYADLLEVFDYFAARNLSLGKQRSDS